MAGVIDETGQQWERCGKCGDWVRIQDLMYEEPTPEYECGRDLCQSCASSEDRRQFAN